MVRDSYTVIVDVARLQCCLQVAEKAPGSWYGRCHRAQLTKDAMPLLQGYTLLLWLNAA
jgi:hypothetical protein